LTTAARKPGTPVSPPATAGWAAVIPQDKSNTGVNNEAEKHRIASVLSRKCQSMAIVVEKMSARRSFRA
jgi:hypothetical protein